MRGVNSNDAKIVSLNINLLLIINNTNKLVKMFYAIKCDVIMYNSVLLCKTVLYWKINLTILGTNATEFKFKKD